ncbi:MAG: flagellin [Ruminiclostridium sp.]|nr:flagellin [Ruminiclostridium sp.]
MRINHNLASLNTYRQLTVNNANGSKSLEKLSSGLRINRAGDDAAGLAISEKMRGQIRGLSMASRNSQDTISLIQTAEGALNETHSILQRMRELAVQSANDTNTDSDRSSLQNEVSQLTNEIDRIAKTTEFNTKKLLNGDLVGVSGHEDGEFALESTFANGSVTISGTGTLEVSMFAETDVIQIRIIDDLGAGALSGMTVSVTTVLGNIATASVKVSALIYITAAAGTGSTVSDGVDQITFTVTNGASIESGDVITISLTKATAANTDATKEAVAQIGANVGQTLNMGISDMTATAIGVRSSAGDAIDIDDRASASGAIKLVDNALEKVSTERAKLGAFQNRLEHTISNLDTSAENLQASESRIRDVDMAKEMMEFTKNNILTQAAQAMLAQANQQPQGVLQLLR